MLSCTWGGSAPKIQEAIAKVIIGDGVSSYKVFAVSANLFLNAGAAFSADKLIALTFDDGPRPYVLFGSKRDHAGRSLVNVLDDNDVRARFFRGMEALPEDLGRTAL